MTWQVRNIENTHCQAHDFLSHAFGLAYYENEPTINKGLWNITNEQAEIGN